MLFWIVSILFLTATTWLALHIKTELGPESRRLTLAPMIGGLDACLQNTRSPTSPYFPPTCTGPEGSAAALVEATLKSLGPVQSPDLDLGYTLKAPLLDFLRPEGSDWRIDAAAIRRLVNTVRDVPQPVVLYLFSNHFESKAPIEKVLASNPANMAVTAKGTLPVDLYYDTNLFPWSVADTTNDISHRRQQVIEAIATELCLQPAAVRERILGITLLGEVHQHFPHFQTGMGFAGPYEVSDYSAKSRQGFRQYLAQQFGSVNQLNSHLGSQFPSWETVEPPDRDIRSQPLEHYWQHIDAFAHGTLPVSGWVAPSPTPALGQDFIKIYLNGQFWERTRVGLGRQDVLEAEPSLGTANVGWRLDLDFSRLPAGIHQLDVYLERPQEPLRHLGARHISVMDKNQTTPQPVQVRALPVAEKAPEGLRYYIDSPVEASSYYFNPLVKLWHTYRNTQVVDYLQHFNQIVRQSCLAERPIFIHQLIPFSNPSWDGNKYAVDASLQPLPGLQLGISLYGESAYGNSFFEWLQGTRHRSYGVTEFHPLRAMSPQELSHALDRHRVRGARFVSMFVDTKGIDASLQSTATKQELSMFSFDPANAKFGSNTLYASMKQALASKAPLAQIQDTPRPHDMAPVLQK